MKEHSARLTNRYSGHRLQSQNREIFILSQPAGNKSKVPTLFETLIHEMQLKNYSYKTIKAYKSCIRGFIRYISPKHPRDADNEEIRKYLLYLIAEKKTPASTVNQVINALRFLFVDVYHKEFIIENLPRPQREYKLPEVLNEEEILRIFQSVNNIKHRTMLMLTYASGLRVSEVVKLRTEDIDGSRGLIHIRGAKGKKDRYTLLPESIRSILNNYWKTYNLGHSGWLFPGVNAGYHLSVRSIQAVFERAVTNAGINKPVSMHTLRHSFATHLLEQGTVHPGITWS